MGQNESHVRRTDDGMREEARRTLDADMDVILRLFGFSGILVGFGEGVCGAARLVSISAWVHFGGRDQVQVRIRGSG